MGGLGSGVWGGGNRKRRRARNHIPETHIAVESQPTNIQGAVTCEASSSNDILRLHVPIQISYVLRPSRDSYPGILRPKSGLSGSMEP